MHSQKSRISPQNTPSVPREFGGMWIAWNFEGTRIIGSGIDLKTAEAAAREAGEKRPRLERVPRADVRIVGGAKR